MTEKRNQRLKTFARQLRKDQTPAEQKLWAILRGTKLGGWKFRRQYQIAGYIVDFMCVQMKVVVELDGDSHLGKYEYDKVRNEKLVEEGCTVLRFENCEIMNEEDRVIERIVVALKKSEGMK